MLLGLFNRILLLPLAELARTPLAPLNGYLAFETSDVLQSVPP